MLSFFKSSHKISISTLKELFALNGRHGRKAVNGYLTQHRKASLMWQCLRWHWDSYVSIRTPGFQFCANAVCNYCPCWEAADSSLGIIVKNLTYFSSHGYYRHVGGERVEENVCPVKHTLINKASKVLVYLLLPKSRHFVGISSTCEPTVKHLNDLQYTVFVFLRFKTHCNKQTWLTYPLACSFTLKDTNSCLWPGKAVKESPKV